jgi:hypothetical protein
MTTVSLCTIGSEPSGHTRFFSIALFDPMEYNVSMDTPERHTVKVSAEAIQALRLLAAYQGERQYVILARLITQALQKEVEESDHPLAQAKATPPESKEPV